MIPATYQEWRQCITQHCGIELNLAFITARIGAMSDPETPANRLFIGRYGKDHYQHILAWLQQARQELPR